jgi:hypothetical protein
MKPTPIVYEKLRGWRGSVGSRFSLWLGADHVLLVEANMMTERYQRVWLRDVQGFLVRPSREARWAVGVGAGLVLIFGALALLLGDDLAPVFWTLLGLSSPVLLFGLISARTHHFYAVTAVQRTEWPNVARRRHVRKVLARLEPLVREAQREEPPVAPGAGEAAAAHANP